MTGRIRVIAGKGCREGIRRLIQEEMVRKSRSCFGRKPKSASFDRKEKVCFGENPSSRRGRRKTGIKIERKIRLFSTS